MSSFEATVKALRRKLDNSFESVQSINNQGRKALIDAEQVIPFRAMIDDLPRYMNKFEKIWDDLIDAFENEDKSTDFSTVDDTTLYSNVRRYYFESKSNILKLTKIERVDTTPTVLNISQADVSNSIAHLPPLPLPKFDGKIMNWPKFRDAFKSIVHEDNAISDIRKFHYLVTSVSGSAHAMVTKLPLLSENYWITWTTLENAFDKKRLISFAYLTELVNFKPLQGKSTASSLQLFLTKVCDNVNAFKSMPIPDRSDFLLFFLSIRCLDQGTRELFEQHSTNVDFPTFDSLASFVRNRCVALQLSQSEPDNDSNENKSKNNTNLNANNNKGKLKMPQKATLYSSINSNSESSNQSRATTSQSDCFMCGKTHRLIDCEEFSSISNQQRVQLLKAWKGCINCLSSEHNVKSCTSQWNCKFCKKRHHRLLHLSPIKNAGKTSSPKGQQGQSSDAASNLIDVSLTTVSNEDKKVLLGTIVAEVQDCLGAFQSVRIVIDSGSQNSFITYKCLNKLGLAMCSNSKKVSCIGGSSFDRIFGEVSCTIRPKNRVSPNFLTTVQVVKKITNDLPNFVLPKSVWNAYSEFQLADPNFYKSQSVDMLLGCDFVADIFDGQVIDLQNGGPKLFSSSFGFVVMGGIKSSNSSESIALFTSSDDFELGKALHKFWELEETNPFQKFHNDDDNHCENHFVSTHGRDESGRYIVRLPFKNPALEFKFSTHPCMKRLVNLEDKLRRNSLLREHYVSFMTEYLELNHMSLAHNSSKVLIPHHAIFKEDRSQLKLRVVFDASAKVGSTNSSLNENLMIGPKLQTDIRDILLRFRIHEVVFVADIVKMYRQILIHSDDRPYQHILWRFSPSQSVETYELNTLTYGLTSAPFLAIRVLHQLSHDEGKHYPKAAAILTRDTYIDDLVTGASTVDEALELQSQFIGLLEKGCFKLSKWASNRNELLEKVASNNQDPLSLSQEHDLQIKILGLQWDSVEDCFLYKINPPELKFTKRNLLSTVAKIFDPIGFLSPVVLLAKSFIQDAWKANVDWDELIPESLQNSWRQFVEELPLLSEIKILRHVFSNQSRIYQLVGFSDASNKGYSATIYIRTIDAQEIKSHLLIARTKLSPVKTVSIPRLELCGAVLLARTYASLGNFLDMLPPPEMPPCFFSDSTIVLGWINTPLYKLKTFVANRVSEIVELTSSSHWRHVSSEDNASDPSSRGLMPSEILDHSIWWNGPQWLSKPMVSWPESPACSSLDLPELKVPEGCTLVSTSTSSLNWMSRFSSFVQLIRFVGTLRRFIRNFRNKNDKLYGPLSLCEFKEAVNSCVKVVQQHFFFDGSPVRSDSSLVFKRLHKLAPFIDPNEILRVGGRLTKSSISFAAKHPIILPNNCHFTTIMVDYYHKLYLHPGPNLLQALIQLKYWVISLRRLVRQRNFLCMTCFKMKTRAIDAEKDAPKMGTLPEYRVKGGRAFQHVGVDFAGPLQMRDSLRRKAPISKIYVCVFVCMQTKAIHLEAVTSLSTDAFLACFSRFTSRRGLPEAMYSDCGSNFIGARKQLKEMYAWFDDQRTKDKILEVCVIRNIQWHFNPPSSPHMGGLWEAGVKSMKHHLISVAGETQLTFEELTTLLTKIEAILNSRPLCPLSSSPQETEYLSPGHFLIGGNLMDHPAPSLLDVADNRLDRWQLVKKMYEHLWKRWHVEYLSTLQSRAKWTKTSENLGVGDLVLLREQRVPVLQWPLAKVTATHPGSDGVVRYVTVQTPSSSYQRPVVKLVKLLPLSVPAFPDNS